MLLLWASQAAAQTLEAGPLRLKLIGRVQAQFSSTSVDEEALLAEGVGVTSAIPATLFETRRVRFGSELLYENWLTGKIELELGMARLNLRDVYVNLGIDSLFQLRIGQWKKPFSAMQLNSSSRWQVIERAVRIRGLQERYNAQDMEDVLSVFRGRVLFGDEHELLDVQGYLNFDLGAAVLGEKGPFSYQVGVFNGSGTDAVDDTDGKSVVARATVRPSSARPLVLGAALSTRELRLQTVQPTATAAGRIVKRDGAAYEVDLTWGDFRRPGLWLLAEATTGRNLAVSDSADNRNFRAAQAVASWFFPLSHERVEGWELAGRVSWGDPRSGLDGDEGLLLTPGLNLYFSGRNRVMLNWDVFNPSSNVFSTEHALRTQAQVYF